MLASLNHIAGWGEGIEVDTLALLTVNSLKTSWQEEAVGGEFASKFSQKNCSSSLQIPGGHVTGYFLVSILSPQAALCHPTPTTHCYLLTVFPVLWGFLLKKEISLEGGI